MTKLSDSSAYPAALTVDDTAILYVVDNPATTPASKAVAIGDVLKHGMAHGMISVNDNSSGTTLVADAWTKVAVFNAEFGSSKGVTVSHANDKITLTGSGVYRVSYAMSVYDADATDIFARPYLDGAAVPHGQSAAKIAAGKAISLSCEALVDTGGSTAEYVELYVKCSGTSIIITDAQLLVQQVAV